MDINWNIIKGVRVGNSIKHIDEKYVKLDIKINPKVFINVSIDLSKCNVYNIKRYSICNRLDLII